MMHFPLFQISPLFRISQSLGQFVPLFPPKCMFLVIHCEFTPLFSLKRCISPYFGKFIISPSTLWNFFLLILQNLTMMHLGLCITQCTYWTPLEMMQGMGRKEGSNICLPMKKMSCSIILLGQKFIWTELCETRGLKCIMKPFVPLSRTGHISNNLGPQLSATKFDKFRGECGKFRVSPRQGRWNSATHSGYTVKFPRLD